MVRWCSPGLVVRSRAITDLRSIVTYRTRRLEPWGRPDALAGSGHGPPRPSRRRARKARLFAIPVRARLLRTRRNSASGCLPMLCSGPRRV